MDSFNSLSIFNSSIYLYSNCFIFFIIETPPKANETWIHPVFDLMDVDQVVKVRVVHPPLVPVQSQTDLEGEENREDSGSCQHRP